MGARRETLSAHSSAKHAIWNRGEVWLAVVILLDGCEDVGTMDWYDGLVEHWFTSEENGE